MDSLITIDRLEVSERSESIIANGEEMRAALTALYRELLAQSEVSIRAILVVDLSKGLGDAEPLAEGLAAGAGPEARVVLWDPQDPAVDKGKSSSKKE